MSVLTEKPAPEPAPHSAGSPEDVRPHLARRPTWTCRICHQDWPCEPARTNLTTEYDDSVPALGMYLAGLFRSAVGDLDRLHPNPGVDVAALHARFLGWLPTRRGR